MTWTYQEMQPILLYPFPATASECSAHNSVFFSLSDTKDSRELLGRSWSKEESGYLHLQNEEGHQFEIGAPPCSVDDLKFLNHWE